MEAFASVRMNDVHDSFIPGWLPTWKKKHPELLVDPRGMLPSLELYVTSEDFTHKAVRNRKLEIIEEVAQRYDVDGFEFDFIRHPVFFSRTLRGLPVIDEEIEIMTAFMRRIRELTDREAQRRGRPLLLAARVPDDFQLAMNIGLDLRNWLEEDLVDILIAGGGYAPFTLQVPEFTELAHQYDVPVYPCINQGAAENLSRGAFLECVRALAANWYRAGADGIYTWNLGSPFEYKTGQDLDETRRRLYACVEEIGDPKLLEGKDKLFCVDSSPGGVYDYYKHVSGQPPLPVSKRGAIKHGVVGRVPLMVADDVNTARNSGQLKQLRLILDLRGPVRPEAIVCRLNGETLQDGEWVTTDSEKREYRVSYPIDVPPLKQGDNFVVMALKAIPGEPTVILHKQLSSRVEFYGVRLKIDYHSN
jgi:hypothetical protein